MFIKKLLFCTAVMAALFSSAQQMPLDFEDSSERFTGFSGTSFSIATDPTDASNNVGRLVNSGGASFQGAYLDLSRDIDLDMDKVIGMRFYASDNNAHSIILKLESGTNADVEVPRSIAAGNMNTWVSLNFDFANAIVSGSASTINATGQYQRISVFVDGGQTVAGTFLLDDIDDGTTPTSPIDVTYSDLVWSDEFNTTGTNNPVDNANWFHQTQLPMASGWFNGEVQHYTDRLDNSFVENGFLHVNAKRETYTDQGLTTQFTSARLNSKFAFTYGRVDVRARLPLGEGTWPAIWTLGVDINEPGNYWLPFQNNPVNWPACGEIDIMEHGLGTTNHVSAALHTPCAGCFGNTMNFRSRTLQDVANTFHVYSMNWSPDRIVFLVDGIPFYTYRPDPKNPSNWPFDSDQYLLLNVALGGFAGNVEPGFQESAMVIDYVRVYQNTTGIDDAFEASLRIYPNPAKDVIQIHSNATIDGITMYDMLGAKVDPVYNHASGRMNVSTLSTGIYLLRIESNERVAVRKIVVE